MTRKRASARIQRHTVFKYSTLALRLEQAVSMWRVQYFCSLLNYCGIYEGICILTSLLLLYVCSLIYLLQITSVVNLSGVSSVHL